MKIYSKILWERPELRAYSNDRLGLRPSEYRVLSHKMLDKTTDYALTMAKIACLLILFLLTCNICAPVSLKLLLVMYFMCGNLSQNKQLI